MRRHFLLSLLAAALTVGLHSAPALLAADEPRAPDIEKSGAQWITPKTAQAVKRGLDFLAGKQSAEGSFGAGGYGRNVAVVSGWPGWRLSASGSTPGRGPYGRADRPLRRFHPRPHRGKRFHQRSRPARATARCMATASPRCFSPSATACRSGRSIREKLTRAVELIVNTQNNEGGWRYQPVRGRRRHLRHGLPGDGPARPATPGCTCRAETIDAAIEYVKKSQNEDGGFMYMLCGGGPSAFPARRPASSPCISAGIYEGPEIEKGLDYLMAQVAARRRRCSREGHYFYGHYYAVQAMWHAGGDYWSRWYPAIRDALLKRQSDDGSWMDSIGVEYGTSMATIILQIPNNYLPIFQR